MNNTIRTTVIYKNSKLDKGLKSMARKGWRVVSATPSEQGYGCLKTGCLGLIFFPLALLGKKPGKTIVIFER